MFFIGPQTIALTKGNHVLMRPQIIALKKRQPRFYRASNNCLQKKKKKKKGPFVTGPFLCLSLKSEGDLMPIGSQGIGVIEFIYKGGKVKVHLVFSQNRV
jgi:hypothetical protein